MGDLGAPKTMGDKLLQRLMDRFLPETSQWGEEKGWFKRSCVSFLGTLTAILAYAFVISRGILRPGSEFALDVVTPVAQFSVGLVAVIVLPLLIGFSIQRGSPLNFYLWGLVLPVLVFNIIQIGLPEIGPVQIEKVDK